MKMKAESDRRIFFRQFATKAEWVAAIVSELANDLIDGMANSGDVGLVVPGGSTPAPVFTRLAELEIDWRRVHICPTDERWVNTDHADSNERSIRANLLRKAAGAKLHSLWTDTDRPSLASKLIETRISTMPMPFQSVMLGMGEDGHIASLFPGLPETKFGLDLSNHNLCVAIDAPQAGYARMSLTLHALTAARRIYLIITGYKKKEALNVAMSAEGQAIPVSALLNQRLAPVDVFWTA